MTDARAVRQVDEDDAQTAPEAIDIDMLDLRLPCRSFLIAYKVAEPGKFSLTAEFLLRLLRATEGLREESIGEFFAFSPDETRFVIDHAENLGYIRRQGGGVRLTEAGHELFTAGSDEPALFEIQPKRDRFQFDLVSLAPAEWSRLTSFEYELPELAIPDQDKAANASQRVGSSFKRHFQEFRFRRGGSRIEKQSLYTVDDVQAEGRFSSLVPVTVRVRLDNPAFAEINLLSWRSGFELEDRAAVTRSCADFVGALSVGGEVLGQESIDCLAQCAPDQVGRFIRNREFNADAFFRSTARQAGELRSDRPTARVIGHVWTNENRVRFATALKNAALRDPKPPSMIFWLRPALRCWGMTTRLADVSEAVIRQASNASGEHVAVRSVLLTDDDYPHIFNKAFNAVFTMSPDRLPRGLEILLVPGRLAFVLLHTPIGAAHGHPVPLGIVSFDPLIIERVHAAMTEVVHAVHARPAHCDWSSADATREMDEVLDYSASSVRRAVRTDGPPPTAPDMTRSS